MGQLPFLRLLIPAISGILFCKYISPSLNLFSVGVIGLAIIFISFFTPTHKKYGLRWLFGLGLFLFLFSLSTQYYQYRSDQAAYNFPQTKTSYIGQILDLPQQKPRSIS